MFRITTMPPGLVLYTTCNQHRRPSRKLRRSFTMITNVITSSQGNTLMFSTLEWYYQTAEIATSTITVTLSQPIDWTKPYYIFGTSDTTKTSSSTPIWTYFYTTQHILSSTNTCQKRGIFVQNGKACVSLENTKITIISSNIFQITQMDTSASWMTGRWYIYPYFLK